MQLFIEDLSFEKSSTIDGTNGYKSDYDSDDDYSAGDIIGDTAGGTVDSSNTSSNCDIEYINVNF